MSLDEHLIVYMVHSFDSPATNREKKAGTKEDIQMKLCEFLLNLKYYSSRWERALLYSEMAGFMNAEENLLRLQHIKGQGSEKLQAPDVNLISASKGLNDVDWEDVKTPAMDIYLQEFFMYAYSFITKDRKGFFESSEGRTYVRA